MLKRLGFTTILLGLFAYPLAAQNDSASDFGGDSFRSGGTVIVDQSGIDDLFAAGSTVQVKTDIAGSAYIAGRSIDISGAILGDVFAAAFDVTVSGAVGGDVTVAGNALTIGEVGGDLRASGGTLKIEGPVAGYAMLAADELALDSVISGDLFLASRVADFGESARIEGRLVLFEEEVGALTVPDTLVPGDRIERRGMSEWDDTVPSVSPATWQAMVGSFVTGALTIALLASLVAAVMPNKLAQLRRSLLDQPFRNFWFGFLAESVAAGSAIIFAMTLVGILLIPASLLLALAVGFAGYVVAAYAIGVALLMLFGQPEPNSLGTRVIAAGTGALLVSAIALIPFFGWLFALGLVLAGVGSITLMLFRPAFYVGAAGESHA